MLPSWPFLTVAWGPYLSTVIPGLGEELLTLGLLALVFPKGGYLGQVEVGREARAKLGGQDVVDEPLDQFELRDHRLVPEGCLGHAEVVQRGVAEVANQHGRDSEGAGYLLLGEPLSLREVHILLGHS